MTKITNLSIFLVIFHVCISTLNAKVITPLPGVAASGSIIDITKYGAKPSTDIGEALSKAWNEACVSPTNDKVVIPKGDYLMGPLLLKGPCKGPIQLEVAGNIKAPADPADFKGHDALLTVDYVEDLTITAVPGGGVFDGQGQMAWKMNNCDKSSACKRLPYNFRFNFIKNSVISGISSRNSKLFHMSVIGCSNVTLTKMDIYAEPESINTDGMHIAKSEGINVIDVVINTGDDCVSIGDGTKDLTVEKVTCGRGHGLSIGSLGKSANEKPVSGVHIKNCTVKNADNGVRIKTWVDSFPGVVEDLHFEDIVVDNVTHAIVLDQQYCPYNNCKKQAPSKVKVSKVSFKNIRGSTTDAAAVKLDCSSEVPCVGVELEDIDLTFNSKPAVSECANVKPKTTGKINPPACTKDIGVGSASA